MRSRRQFLKDSAAWSALAGLGSAEFARSLQNPKAAGKPNVVVLMLDALRPDYTQVYGAERETTPFLKRLAQRSTVFDRAYSSSTWTAPACASFFTGHYPPAHGIVEGFMAHGRRTDRQEEKGVTEKATSGTVINAFAPDMKLLAEYFTDAGYRSFGFGTNPNIGPEIGFTSGFEVFQSIDDAPAEVVVKEIEPWREELTEGEDPYFLFVHFMDVHKPYHARAPWYQTEEGRDETADAAERYRSELRYLDHHLEALFQRWSWDENTVVLILSDHGEEFGDHGQVGHRFQMHIELNRIFMMATGGGIGRQQRRISSLVGIHDMMSTLLDLTGQAAPEEGTGQSFLPLLAAVPAEVAGSAGAAVPISSDERMLFAHRRKTKLRALDIWAVNYKHWRLIRTGDGRQRLFDTVADPFEQKALPWTSNQELFKRMAKELDDFIRLGFTDRAVKRQIQQSAAEAKLLEELGYVDD